MHVNGSQVLRDQDELLPVRSLAGAIDNEPGLGCVKTEEIEVDVQSGSKYLHHGATIAVTPLISSVI